MLYPPTAKTLKRCCFKSSVKAPFRMAKNIPLLGAYRPESACIAINLALINAKQDYTRHNKVLRNIAYIVKSKKHTFN